MNKVKITSINAPEIIGPYSQAIKAGEYIYVSGCLGIDPKTKMLEKTSIKAEASTTLNNLKNILKAAGATLTDVVKVNIFLSDMLYLSEVNDVYKTFFTEPFPARTTVCVKALPVAANLEIEAVAWIPQKTL